MPVDGATSGTGVSAAVAMIAGSAANGVAVTIGVEGRGGRGAMTGDGVTAETTGANTDPRWPRPRE